MLDFFVLSPKPRSQVRNLKYRNWPIDTAQIQKVIICAHTANQKKHYDYVISAK